MQPERTEGAEVVSRRDKNPAPGGIIPKKKNLPGKHFITSKRGGEEYTLASAYWEGKGGP